MHAYRVHVGAGEIAWRLVAGVVLILANAFFVVSEFSLTRARQFDASDYEGHKSLQLAWKMTERLELYLTGCQLGISATSVLLGVVAEPAITQMILPLWKWMGIEGVSVHAASVAIAVILINLVHKIWGEQAPTYLGVERPKEVAKWTAPALYWWAKITYPIIIAGDGLAKLTLRLFGVRMTRSWTGEGEEGQQGEGDGAKESGEASQKGAPSGKGGYGEMRRDLLDAMAGKVSGDRKQEVLAALEIERVPVRDIMVPRDDLVCLVEGAPFEENRRKMAEHGHSRYPLVGDSLDDFRGIVYVPSIFACLDELRDGRAQLSQVMSEPFCLDASLPVSQVIDRFQEAGHELALVQEDGRTVGLVTATDAFEAIAGELEDPLDRDG